MSVIEIDSPAPPARLDARGHCCERPLIGPNCTLCHRRFDAAGDQIANAFWRLEPDGRFARTRIGD